MAFKIVDCDNVRESFASTGTTITLGGAVANSRAISSISGIASGDAFWAVARKGAELSLGIFTWTSAGGTVAQTTVFYSTNGNAAVSFSSGTGGEIFVDAPSRLFDHLNMIEIVVASASTADIGAAQGKFVELQGTTGVTSFGTSKNKERIVRYTGGGLTLTNSATLVCPLAENLVLATGDIIKVKSDNASTPVWRIINVFRAAPFTGKLIGIQKFTASGTYTRSVGCHSVYVEVRGGGGGGGGVSNAATYQGAAGGGQGGRSIKRTTAMGATETVTVGTGGAGGVNTGGTGGTGNTSSFGAHASATGGTGGGGATGAGNVLGGAGGAGASGDLNFVGQGGSIGSAVNPQFIQAGVGGGEGGGRGLINSAGGVGTLGGGGGGAGTGGGTGYAGGVGGDGYVIVWEFE